MAKSQLSLIDGQAVNAADRPLRALVDDAQTQIEALMVGTRARSSFWTHLFDGAARGNALARHLCQKEESWLQQHDAELAVLHGTIRAIELHLKAEGQL